jgi:hypothetical protein
VRLTDSSCKPVAHSDPPPLLMDCQAIMAEIGVKRATAERVMRCCPVKVVLGRRVFVYRVEVLAVLRSREVRDAA